MTAFTIAALAFCIFTIGLHVASTAVAIVRCRKPRYCPPHPDAPPVTLIRPFCGVDNYAEDTFRSAFTLDYPRCELLFCVAHGDDPIVPLAQHITARYPAANARLLIGDERISANPKLNNIAKGWQAATHEWIVIADSNVLMPRDYLQRLMAAWRPDTGLVCSPPIGCAPEGFWAQIECAFLNTFQARWQYFADTLGFGFAQGKTMLWRHRDLAQAGGIGVLGSEAAEDAAATKLVRSLGLRVRLVDAPFPQPLGARTFTETWKRQARWAQLRRASFPLCYAAEVMSGILPPLLAAGFAAASFGYPVPVTLIALAALWYGIEALLAFTSGWPLSWRLPLYAMVRDVSLPALWVCGWLDRAFVWRGNVMRVEDAGEAVFALE